jgi:hypothetical protein
MAMTRWLTVLVQSALVALPALARPPEGVHNDPEVSRWFRSLQQPGSHMGCCSEADCRRVEARATHGYWQFYLRRGDGEGEFPEAPAIAGWVKVPSDRVLQHTENPTGSAVACWEPWASNLGDGVLCFVPPTMS